MPKRVTTRRIETPELQGEESYIEVKLISFGMSRQIRVFEMLGNARVRNDLKPDEIGKLVDQESKLTENVIFDHLLGWNWVNDNGEPLPLPKTSGDLDKLTLDEIFFILNCIKGTPEKKDTK